MRGEGVRHPRSFPSLKTYQDELSNIKIRLTSASNVLPFQKSILTDKASLLIRQFIKDNLYDRIR